MRRPLLVLLAAALLAAPAAAAPPKPASDKAEVLSVIDRFFSALSRNDDAAVGELVTSEGMIQVQAAQADGSFKLRRLPMAGWLERLKEQPGFDERIWDPVVLRRGPIAVVWAPYEVTHAQGGHCGVDVFDLIKTDDGWKIDNLTWTQEPTACAELKGGR